MHGSIFSATLAIAWRAQSLKESQLSIKDCGRYWNHLVLGLHTSARNGKVWLWSDFLCDNLWQLGQELPRRFLEEAAQQAKFDFDEVTLSSSNATAVLASFGEVVLRKQGLRWGKWFFGKARMGLLVLKIEKLFYGFRGCWTCLHAHRLVLRTMVKEGKAEKKGEKRSRTKGKTRRSRCDL